MILSYSVNLLVFFLEWCCSPLQYTNSQQAGRYVIYRMPACARQTEHELTVYACAYDSELVSSTVFLFFGVMVKLHQVEESWKSNDSGETTG